MKKQNIFPVIGIISATLLVLSSILTFCLSLSDISAKARILPYQLLNPFFIFCIFISLKHIIVNISRQDNFKIVINSILICQIILSFVIWVSYFKVIPVKYLPVPVALTGILITALYIWFFILIFKTEKTELNNLLFLEYFAVIVMVFMVLHIAVALTSGNNLLHKISNLSEGLPFIFLIFFFSGYLNNSNNRTSNETGL